MSNVVGVVLVLLALVVFVMCLIGLISPKWLRFSKDGTPPKRTHILLGMLFVPLVLFGIGGGLLDPVEDKGAPQTVAANDAPKQEQAAPVPSAPPAQPVSKNLGITPDQFRTAYNGLITQIDKQLALPKLQVTDGSVYNTFTVQLSSAAHAVGTVEKQSGKLRELMLIAGSGKTSDNMQTIAVLLTAAHVTTQGATKEEISKAVSELTTQALTNSDKPGAKALTAVVGNREYVANASKLTGLMFSIGDAR